MSALPEPWGSLITAGLGAACLEIIRSLLTFRQAKHRQGQEDEKQDFDQNVTVRKLDFDQNKELRDELRRDMADLRVQVRDLRLKIDDLAHELDTWRRRYFDLLLLFKESKHRSIVFKDYIIQVHEWLAAQKIDLPMVIPPLIGEAEIDEPVAVDTRFADSKGEENPN